MNKLVRVFLFVVSIPLILLALSSFACIFFYKEEALGYFIIAFIFGVPGLKLLEIARRGYFFKPESEKNPITYGLSKTFSRVFFVMSTLSFILSLTLYSTAFMYFAGISFLIAIVSASYYSIAKKSLKTKEYLKTYFGNETVEKIKKLNETIPSKPQIILLDPDEDVRMKGYVSIACVPPEPEIVDSLRQEAKLMGEYRHVSDSRFSFPRLYLTNKRLIIEGERVTECTIVEAAYSPLTSSFTKKSDKPYVIFLEEITGMILTKDVSSFMNLRIYFKPHGSRKSLEAKIITHEAEKWKEEIDKLRKERIEELELKKKVVIDFSTIRNYFSEKGLVVYTVKCPNCGAPLKLPEKGKEIKCEYCEATVYAEDILKRLKPI